MLNRACRILLNGLEEESEREGSDPLYSICHVRAPYVYGEIPAENKKFSTDIKAVKDFYGIGKRVGMSLHSLLYEWDLERVVMSMSGWGLNA